MTPEFAYMRWAKEHQPLPRYSLALSGLAPPDNLVVDVSDVAQHGHDMPPRARAAVAQRFGTAEDRVMLTLGTSHAFYLLCAELSPDDTVWVESPCYEMLRRLPELRGARVEPIERSFGSGFRLPDDLLDRVRRKRPKMVLLSNPHNPSGVLLDNADLAPLQSALQEVDGVLAVDEVYLEYLPDAPTRSAVHLGDNVAIASSLTKAYGLGTARFGWLVASEARIRRAIRYNDFISVLYPNPSAAVGLAALAQIDALRVRATTLFARHWPIVQGWLAGRSDAQWHAPDGPVIAFPRFRQVSDSRAFVARMLATRETLAVPGWFFGAEGHLRLGFGGDEPQLREALDRLGLALDDLSRG